MKKNIVVVCLWVMFLTGCGNSNDLVVDDRLTEKSQTEEVQPLSSNAGKKDVRDKFDINKVKKDYQLTSFEVLSISENPYDNGPALAVSFSVPLDLNRNIQNHLSVADQKGIPVEGAWVVNQQRTRAFFQYIEPNKTYHVMVESGLYSINGQELVQSFDKKLKTNPLKNSVKFANKGKVLPSKLTRGITIESVNKIGRAHV